MRRIVAVSALSIIVVGTGVVACDRVKAPDESTVADVQRDLSLASSVQRSRTGFVSAIEQSSNGAPSGNNSGVRVGVPTKKRAPSPAKSPTLADVATAPPTVHETDATVTVAQADPVPAPAPVPQQAPIMMVSDPMRGSAAPSGGPSADAGSGELGHFGNGERGRGDIGAVGGGAIIRGGRAGVDNCEPIPRRGATGIIGATFGGNDRGRAPAGSIPGGSGARNPLR
ncbi:MAG: hypothetical protein M3Y64_07340 [Gemmatimonadota bacterium]|nr:hypothetical protein [Gemmatimonadota bacterium]